MNLSNTIEIFKGKSYDYKLISDSESGSHIFLLNRTSDFTSYEELQIVNGWYNNTNFAYIAYSYTGLIPELWNDSFSMYIMNEIQEFAQSAGIAESLKYDYWDYEKIQTFPQKAVGIPISPNSDYLWNFTRG